MASDQPVVAPMVTRRVPLPDSSVADFGGMLRVLRHRARLTQRELGLAVGYSEAQISRLEKGKRLPDPSVVAALFLPALGLASEPELPLGEPRAVPEDAQQSAEIRHRRFWQRHAPGNHGCHH